MKRISKLLALFLSFTIIITSYLTVYATEYNETGEGTNTTKVQLTVDNSNVAVGVPVEIIISGTPNSSGEYIGEYAIKVTGDINGTEEITVMPEETCLLKQKGKDEVAASITQSKITFNCDDLISNNTANGKITAQGLTAGSWSGEFTFNIYMANNINETKYVHNALFYSDNHLYSGARNNIIMYDIDDNNELTENEVFNIKTEPGQATYIVTGFAEKDEFLYASVRQEVSGMSYNENNETIGDLYIFNKNDLSLVNKIDLGWKGSRVIINDNLMIVNLQMKGYNIYTLDNPTNPQLIYSYVCNGDQEFQDGEIVRHNEKIYYVSAGFGFGLYVFDITNTVNSKGVEAPIRVGYMPFSYYKNSTPVLSGLHIYDVVVNYPYIYCSIAPTSTSSLNTEKDVRGILTVNLEDVIKYTVSSKIPFTVTEIPDEYKICQGMSGDLQPTYMAYYNGYIYTSIGYRGIGVFSIKNNIPEFVSLIDTSNRNIRPVCVDSKNGILYAGSGVSDPYKSILHFDITSFE